jgi:protoheme IX farnesyltransferase
MKTGMSMAEPTGGPRAGVTSSQAVAAGGMADFVALTKPRLNFLALLTTLAGLYLASPDGVPLGLLVHTLVGSALVAGGAASLNQALEHRTDALMRRTRQRPVPDGRIGLAESVWFGLFLSVAGIGELWFGANGVAAGVALVTHLSYVLVYTPLKTRTSLSTLVGAVPGALPPVIGWSAATGEISLPAIVLFGIVFMWQMPHFLAIAWMYRDDYAAAGIPLLPVTEPDGRRTGRQALLYAAALWPVSILPAVVGLAGVVYCVVATLLGMGFVSLGGAFARDRSLATARRLFFFSILYLPLLLLVLVIDRLWLQQP